MSKGFKNIHEAVLINEILPRLSLTELVHLCITNKYIAKICNNDHMWKNKTFYDYPNVRVTSKPIGLKWKDFYYRLKNPRGMRKFLYIYDDYGYPNTKLYSEACATLPFYSNITSLNTLYNYLNLTAPDYSTGILSFVYSEPKLFTTTGMNLLDTILKNQIVTLIIRKEEAFSTLPYEQFIELAPWYAENVLIIHIIPAVNLDLTFPYYFSEHQLKLPLL